MAIHRNPGGEISINVVARTIEDYALLLERELQVSLSQLEGRAPLLSRMAQYHLGWIDPAGEPTDPEIRFAVQGKRIRPQLAFMSCVAVGGDPAVAAPLAAAIELLHNFTLIHDDIQDRSPNRRHRATVWRIWGDAQAINAGDALFADAQRTLLRTGTTAIPAETLLHLVDEFNRITIEIVRGQVKDLEFEQQGSVSPDDYLSMINDKTAAILRFAAWAGAIVGGAPVETAERLGRFGESLGIGFQIRDDVLGIWGTREQTGKDQGDDIRRRKKSLPILMLMNAAEDDETTRLRDLFASDEIDADGVAEVLAMMDRHGVEAAATEQVAHYHAQAADSLHAAMATLPDALSVDLEMLIRRLDTRSS